MRTLLILWGGSLHPLLGSIPSCSQGGYLLIDGESCLVNPLLAVVVVVVLSKQTWVWNRFEESTTDSILVPPAGDMTAVDSTNCWMIARVAVLQATQIGSYLQDACRGGRSNEYYYYYYYQQPIVPRQKRILVQLGRRQES